MLIQKKTLPKFRLTLSSEETHEEIHRLTITKLGFYGILLLGLSTIIGLVLCLLLFTPLRKSIPGYPDPHFRHDAIYNAIKIDSLENIITRWEFYAANLSAALGGDVDVNLEENLKNNSTKYLKDISEEQMREADSLLREKVKKEKE